MAYKHVRRTVDASVYKVSRRGTEGIAIEVSHSTRGKKHHTHYVDTINLDFCTMRRMGGRFHEIMDELQSEWNKTKSTISGE